MTFLRSDLAPLCHTALRGMKAHRLIGSSLSDGWLRAGPLRSGSAWTGPASLHDGPICQCDMMTSSLMYCHIASHPHPRPHRPLSLLLAASEAALPTSNVANWYSALVVSRVINSHSASANIRHRCVMQITTYRRDFTSSIYNANDTKVARLVQMFCRP